MLPRVCGHRSEIPPCPNRIRCALCGLHPNLVIVGEAHIGEAAQIGKGRIYPADRRIALPRIRHHGKIFPRQDRNRPLKRPRGQSRDRWGSAHRRGCADRQGPNGYGPSPNSAVSSRTRPWQAFPNAVDRVVRSSLRPPSPTWRWLAEALVGASRVGRQIPNRCAGGRRIALLRISPRA